MILHARRWGEPQASSVVCVHGVAQHSGIFAALGSRLAAQGHSVLAVDLRGHGKSDREPPWNTETHVGDLLDTLDAAGVERATWIGHSFGGRVVAAAAAEHFGRTAGLALLDPGLEVSPAHALRSAEIERLDWSFATVDGAVNALTSNEGMAAAPAEVVRAYVEDDLRKGPDGRYRFRFSPSAAVVAWSEVTRPAPPIVRVPTLLVLATASLAQAVAKEGRYGEELGDLLTRVVVPNGHHVLWAAPHETETAIEAFLAPPPT